jgi:hypothetical protein
MKYDKQLLIQFMTGEHVADYSVENMSLNLQSKLGQQVLPIYSVKVSSCKFGEVTKTLIPVEKRQKPAKLDLGCPDGTFRLYLNAHGSWESQTAGGITGEDAAETLYNMGLRDVTLISVLSCNAARSGDAHVGTLDSFAGRLHRKLKELGVVTVVYARSYTVNVITPKTVKTFNLLPALIGRKSTVDEKGEYVRRRSGSKWKFFYTGDSQLVAPFLYPGDQNGKETQED